MGFHPQPKPETPLVLERHARKREHSSHEDFIKREAKRRDRMECRWPRCEFRKVVQPIDGAHVFQAKGMGGDPRHVRTERKHVMALCRLHHKAQEKHDLEVEPLTPDLADGPCMFWDNRGQRYMVAQERAIGILDRD
jgi:hypothetical protein